MPSSLLTKKRIAKAFKKQLTRQGFDRLSVVDIMQEASLRRQTFYNHFLDKYELLDWIFETELQEHITDNLNYISGSQLLEEVLYYLAVNQDFYVQVLAIRGQNDFVSYLEQYFQVLVEKIIREYASQKEIEVGEEQLAFSLSYHARAWVALVESELQQQPCRLQTLGKLLLALVTKPLI